MLLCVATEFITLNWSVIMLKSVLSLLPVFILLLLCITTRCAYRPITLTYNINIPTRTHLTTYKNA